MKIGDLVQYKIDVLGLEKFLGIVVGWNGDTAVIWWNFNRGIQTEDMLFIEAVNEKRS